MTLIKIHLARLLFFPSLLCLDAPFVALGWAFCLVQDLDGAGLDGSSAWSGAALFLSVWMIYLFDRLFDVSRSGASVPRTPRHEWARRHRSLLGGLFAAAFVSFLVAVLPRLEGKIIVVGLAIGFFTGLYYVAFRFSRWYAVLGREVPFKEITIALCFTGGILLVASPSVFTYGLVPLLAGYLALFTANCLLISRAESGIDRCADPAAYFSEERSLAPHANLPGRGAILAVAGGFAILLLEGEWLRSSLSLIVCGLLTWMLARRGGDDDNDKVTQPLADGIQLLPWIALAGEVIWKIVA